MRPPSADPNDPAYFESSTVRALLAGYGPRAAAGQDQRDARQPGGVAQLIRALRIGADIVAALFKRAPKARLGRRVRATPLRLRSLTSRTT